MGSKISFKNFDFLLLVLFVYSAILSVTLSQFFAVLSILCYFNFKRPNFKDFPRLFWVGFSLYILILISSAFQSCESPYSFGKKMLKSEFGDIWMLLILLPTSGFSIAQKTKLKTHLKFASLLLITFGCISIFFPYRISTFVMDGFQFLIGRRLPHQIAFLDFWDLAIYLPIGIQNTHLTYGGLLALFLPAVWFHFYRLLRLHLHSKKFNKFPLIIFGIYSILGLLVLLLNQSRSIWIGLITAYILLYKPKSSLNLFKKHKYLSYSHLLF